ncbi:MAG: glycine cleavage system protein GcvH [Candidatus Brocadiae bacterium]|nr:glycine cleavage system protein GcvH [Candidatus Brocadiia bacterium]
MYSSELKYTKSHEWIRVNGKKAKLGITAFAIESLTDLTFLQFNVDEGEKINQGHAVGDVESVKTTSQIFTPVSGTVVAVHKDLPDMLEDLMKDPYETGWMVEIEMSDPSQANSLMDAKKYEEHVASESHH